MSDKIKKLISQSAQLAGADYSLGTQKSIAFPQRGSAAQPPSLLAKNEPLAHFLNAETPDPRIFFQKMLHSSKAGATAMARKFETRDTTQRSHRITCRLSDDEWEQLQIVTEALGLTCSEYVRSVLLTSRISRPMLEVKGDSATLQQIAAQLGTIGSNVNQIARHLNQGLLLAQSIMVPMSRPVTEKTA